MCQQIWAGVSPSLPIPKLTQYIQFVKSGQKIWAFGQNPKEQLLSFGKPSLTIAKRLAKTEFLVLFLIRPVFRTHVSSVARTLDSQYECRILQPLGKA